MHDKIKKTLSGIVGLLFIPYYLVAGTVKELLFFFSSLGFFLIRQTELGKQAFNHEPLLRHDLSFTKGSFAKNWKKQYSFELKIQYLLFLLLFFVTLPFVFLAKRVLHLHKWTYLTSFLFNFLSAPFYLVYDLLNARKRPRLGLVRGVAELMAIHFLALIFVAPLVLSAQFFINLTYIFRKTKVNNNRFYAFGTDILESFINTRTPSFAKLKNDLSRSFDGFKKTFVRVKQADEHMELNKENTEEVTSTPSPQASSFGSYHPSPLKKAPTPNGKRDDVFSDRSESQSFASNPSSPH